jgi:hypothetical protein
MQMTNLSFFVCRLKINHKSLGSYTFILEDGTVANNDLPPPPTDDYKKMKSRMLLSGQMIMCYHPATVD